MNLAGQTEYINNIDNPALILESLTHASRGPSEHCLASEPDIMPIYTMLRQSSKISLEPQKIATTTLVYYMCPYHTMMTTSSDSSTAIYTISIPTVHPICLYHWKRSVGDDNKENEYISLILGPHCSSARPLFPTVGFLLWSKSSFTGCQSTSKRLDFHNYGAASNHKAVDGMSESTASDVLRSCFHELEAGQTFEIDVSANTEGCFSYATSSRRFLAASRSISHMGWIQGKKQ